MSALGNRLTTFYQRIKVAAALKAGDEIDASAAMVAAVNANAAASANNANANANAATSANNANANANANAASTATAAAAAAAAAAADAVAVATPPRTTTRSPFIDEAVASAATTAERWSRGFPRRTLQDDGPKRDILTSKVFFYSFSDTFLRVKLYKLRLIVRNI